MHPGASRFARRFPVPLLLFNAKAQFDALRRDGRFDRMQSKIRERDVRLQGSVNPKSPRSVRTQKHDSTGREVEPQRQCPSRTKSEPSLGPSLRVAEPGRVITHLLVHRQSRPRGSVRERQTDIAAGA